MPLRKGNEMIHQYQAAFPDYPPADMPALPYLFDDSSWKNDVCPSYSSELFGLRIWIDYVDPAQREIDQGERFLVTPLDDGTHDVFVQTDDWNAVLAYVEEHISEQQACCQHRDSGRGVCIDCGKFI
jgi:hypothetical protein